MFLSNQNQAEEALIICLNKIFFSINPLLEFLKCSTKGVLKLNCGDYRFIYRIYCGDYTPVLPNPPSEREVSLSSDFSSHLICSYWAITN